MFLINWMLLGTFCLIASPVAHAALQCTGTLITDETEIDNLLIDWNQTMSSRMNIAVTADWNWGSNLTDYNKMVKAEENAKLAEDLKAIWEQALCVRCGPYCSDKTNRTIHMYQTIDLNALPAEAYDEYIYVQISMEDIYGKAEVCRPTYEGSSECLILEPDLETIVETSRDYCELQWAWEGWRNETGKKIRGYFTSYVHLQNEAARLNDFESAKEMWTKSYTMDEEAFFDQVQEAWESVKPLYEQLHAFVRTKLEETYPDVDFPTSGHIPAHLLGNMWAQDWSNIFDLVVPDSTAEAIDITKLLEDNNISRTQLYVISDDFFQSIGMEPMTDDFWNKSILIKPDGIDMVCHASAWDFYKLTDFRIKQCTEVTQKQFQTVHHEMGHIQYFMHYKYQPVEFRNGANPGFHEAIGDLIALSVMTPEHLKTIGLLDANMTISNGTYLNSMMYIALQKVAFVPFGYLMDKYRWDVFTKNTSFYDLNTAWWNIRCDMQGVSPPVNRSENDFDPGAKYHTPASVPYIRYFFSFIAQFQFHNAICREMGFTEDFHKCDIYNNKNATKGLRDAMELGQSLPYPDVLEKITGSRTLNANDLLLYFKPLQEFLEKANNDAKVTPGWKSGCNHSPGNTGNCDYSAPRFEPTTSNPPTTTDSAAPLTQGFTVFYLAFMTALLLQF